MWVEGCELGDEACDELHGRGCWHCHCCAIEGGLRGERSLRGRPNQVLGRVCLEVCESIAGHG